MKNIIVKENLKFEFKEYVAFVALKNGCILKKDICLLLKIY